MKRTLFLILTIASMLIGAAILTGCDGSSSSGDDYGPGNPQYEYDAWKAQQDYNNYVAGK